MQNVRLFVLVLLGCVLAALASGCQFKNSKGETIYWNPLEKVATNKSGDSPQSGQSKSGKTQLSQNQSTKKNVVRTSSKGSSSSKAQANSSKNQKISHSVSLNATQNSRKLIFSKKPAAKDGKKVISQNISDESDGAIKLVSFEKTNGKQADVHGIKIYMLEYDAEIEFSRNCKWRTEGPYRPNHRGFGVVETKAQAEKKGGYWAGFGNLSQNPGTTHNRGDRVQFSGQMTFEKTERGWRQISQ